MIKSLSVLLFCVSISGCAGLASIMEKLNQPPAWPHDKIPIYPDQGELRVPVGELDKYKCVTGVLACDIIGGRTGQAFCTCEKQLVLQ